MTKPLRIALIAQGGDNWLGGVEYTKNIVFALASLPAEVRSTFEVCLICSRQLKDVQSEMCRHGHVSETHYFDATQDTPTLSNLVRRATCSAVFGQSDLRLYASLRKAKPDFVYPYFDMVRWGRPFRSAAWIPDCQHRYLPQFFTEQGVERRDRWFASVADRASVIVFSSKTAEADFRKFYPKAKRYDSEVLSFRVYPLPEWYETDPLSTQAAYHLPDRFFLINNQFWQHKNHLMVFQALKILRDQSIHPVIVCTGGLYDSRKPSFLDATLQTINTFGIAHQVYVLGIVPRLDMISLMRRALAVVQPSLFEGWSTVVEEARCLGKSIILSDISVHREQDPPHSVFFQTGSAEHLAEILADSWRGLQPGPNREQETTAQKSNLREVQAFGSRFLQIAKG